VESVKSADDTSNAAKDTDAGSGDTASDETALIMTTNVVYSAESADEDEGDGLTPDGNLTLVDDYAENNEDGSGKQFVTLVTKDGNYFYLIIDRDDDGDENVHFLNLVDEADLLALMDEDEAAQYTTVVDEPDEPAVVVTEEPEETETVEPDDEPEESKNINFAPILLILAMAGVGGFFAFTKLKENKKKQEQVKPDPDADYVDELENDADFDIPDDVEDEDDESTTFDADDNEPV
jgi:hypothetical protein